MMDTQREIDAMAEALRAQGLTWSQTNFSVSLVRNAAAAERERCATLRAALVELRERIKGHPAYADLTEDEETEIGGDTAELSYLARVADVALGPNVEVEAPLTAPRKESNGTN